MKNEELLQQLELNNKNKATGDADVEEKKVKFLIFTIQDKKYAIPADVVREIVLDIPLFYIPFVPPFVRGLINRHGEPYSVIDLKILFEKEPLESAKYLILKMNNDQTALIITDVIEIKNVPESEVHNIPGHEDNKNYFSGTISIGNNEILIVNVITIIKQLSDDIENF